MQFGRQVSMGIAAAVLVLAVLQLPLFLAMPVGPLMLANALIMAGSAAALCLLRQPRAVAAQPSTAPVLTAACEALSTIGLLLFTLLVLLVGGLGLLFTFA